MNNLKNVLTENAKTSNSLRFGGNKPCNLNGLLYGTVDQLTKIV